MKLGIEGFHAIVTGSTKGIGKAIVEALLREGCNVSYCARHVTGEEFAGVSDKEPGISSDTKARAIGSVLDMGDNDKIEPWIKAAVEEFGRLDIVISNVSAQRATPSIENWEISFKTDILGSALLIDHSVPYLEKSPAPSITFTGSIVQGEVFFSPLHEKQASPYGSFKAALAHHSITLAHVLGEKQIRVNNIAPGLIKFPGGSWEEACDLYPERVKPFLDKVALGNGDEKWGTPKQVADVTVFLASPRASYVSGATIVIDGAFRAGMTF